MTRARSLVLAGAVLAVLSLGLPWGSYGGGDGVYTGGFQYVYTYSYCGDGEYCYGYEYQYVPGYYVGGYGGSYAGTDSGARFFVAGALTLGLIGWRRRRAVLLRAGVAVALLGVALYRGGLTGGAMALIAAAVCFWLASRRMSTEPSPVTSAA